MKIFTHIGDRLQGGLLKLAINDRAFGVALLAVGVIVLILSTQISTRKIGE